MTVARLLQYAADPARSKATDLEGAFGGMV
jgi:hypothetical protein